MSLAGADAVVVPAPIVELDEPDARLDQPTGEQAVVGERRVGPLVGDARVGGRVGVGDEAGLRAVQFEDVPRLAGDVHDLRGRHLHPVGELVLSDASDGLGVADRLGLPAIEQAERVECLASAGRGPSPPGWTGTGPGRPASGTGRLDRPTARSRSPTRSCPRRASCRRSSGRRSPAGPGSPSPDHTSPTRPSTHRRTAVYPVCR